MKVLFHASQYEITVYCKPFSLQNLASLLLTSGCLYCGMLGNRWWTTWQLRYPITQLIKGFWGLMSTVWWTANSTQFLNLSSSTVSVWVWDSEKWPKRYWPATHRETQCRP